MGPILEALSPSAATSPHTPWKVVTAIFDFLADLVSSDVVSFNLTRLETTSGPDAALHTFVEAAEQEAVACVARALELDDDTCTRVLADLPSDAIRPSSMESVARAKRELRCAFGTAAHYQAFDDAYTVKSHHNASEDTQQSTAPLAGATAAMRFASALGRRSSRLVPALVNMLRAAGRRATPLAAPYDTVRAAADPDGERRAETAFTVHNERASGKENSEDALSPVMSLDVIAGMAPASVTSVSGLLAERKPESGLNSGLNPSTGVAAVWVWVTVSDTSSGTRVRVLLSGNPARRTVAALDATGRQSQPLSITLCGVVVQRGKKAGYHAFVGAGDKEDGRFECAVAVTPPAKRWACTRCTLLNAPGSKRCSPCHEQRHTAG